MGHDYLDLADGHIQLNDFHIVTLGHFFAHCASAASPESLGTDDQTLGELRSFFAGWNCLGPGVCVGTDFNTFATSPERYGVLRGLFDQTLDYIAVFGDLVPLDYLARHVNRPMRFFTAPQPTRVYREAVESLIELLPSGS